MSVSIQEAGSQAASISLEQFSAVIAAIHEAAASPDRWPDAVSAVGRLLNSSDGPTNPAGNWEELLGLGASGGDESQMYKASAPSAQRMLALLAPHFATARQIQMRLAEALPGRVALACLDRLAMAAFIVDRVGVVMYRNASAHRLLDDAASIVLKGPRLRFNQPRLHSAFEAALRRATQIPAHFSLLPMAFSEKEIYEVSVSPLEGHPTAVSSVMPLALVVITPPRPDEKSVVQRVRQLYGLTEAEARVMAALTLGATVDEIAGAHGVRASTVRAQVRSIFEKTGVNRQCDLVRLALTGAPLVARPDH